MRMMLKNKEKTKSIFRKINIDKFKKYLTYKNLLIFLVSFICISIIIGILFYSYMGTEDKELINNSIDSYFSISSSYNYLDSLKKSILNNMGNNIIIWLLGISIIGVFIVIFILFTETFSIGFTIASIIGKYKAKGLLAVFSYLFPNRLLYLLMLFIITYFAIRFSINLIKFLFLKKEIDLHSKLKKYIKILLVCIIIGIVCSFLEVFISPLMIKLFNSLL